MPGFLFSDNFLARGSRGPFRAPGRTAVGRGRGGSVDARATKTGTPQCRWCPARRPCTFFKNFQNHVASRKITRGPDNPRPASGNRIYSPTWPITVREHLFLCFVRGAPKKKAPGRCPGESSGVQAKRVLDKMAFPALAPSCFLVAFARARTALHALQAALIRFRFTATCTWRLHCGLVSRRRMKCPLTRSQLSTTSTWQLRCDLVSRPRTKRRSAHT